MTKAIVIYLPTLPIDPETGDLDSPSIPKRRVKKQTPDERTDIGLQTATLSLPELAVMLCVSHETIRRIVWQVPRESIAAVRKPFKTAK